MIDNDAPLILANSDQYLEWDPYEFLVRSLEVDGLISCFEADHPKWSYARVDDNGRVTEVAEKRVISNLATTGIYYFSKGSQFVRCADSMISKNIRTNGEFYNCPIYNEIIKEGGNVGVHMCDRMWGIGVPGDLDVFLKHERPTTCVPDS
jgi:dTDP-glucose pyrophosphorylase